MFDLARFRVFTVGDLAVSNTILFTANLGLGFYVYYRHHLHRLRPWDRVEFSVFSTTIFNFGSLLAAVLIKALLPNRTPSWTRCLLGSVLSVYLLSRAHKYLRYVDERSARKSPTPRSSLTCKRMGVECSVVRRRQTAANERGTRPAAIPQ
ncbi:unnamed protein product [Heligmosomoides polygyrus]|uniref:GtrA domain-containing protein n=1 Tax=Heligmosomoides polygyrus TaxID=6339 RepID=A0A183GP52_HELPZ|nr:unnamed protein product [Heligmosomoides polygyrus]